MMSYDEKILEELHAIKTILIITNNEKIDVIFNEVVNTVNRRKMWAMIDGVKMPKDIADSVGISAMAVSDFLKRVSEVGFVKYELGKPPKKSITYTPAAWLEDTKEEK